MINWGLSMVIFWVCLDHFSDFLYTLYYRGWPSVFLPRLPFSGPPVFLPRLPFYRGRPSVFSSFQGTLYFYPDSLLTVSNLLYSPLFRLPYKITQTRFLQCITPYILTQTPFDLVKIWTFDFWLGRLKIHFILTWSFSTQLFFDLVVFTKFLTWSKTSPVLTPFYPDSLFTCKKKKNLEHIPLIILGKYEKSRRRRADPQQIVTTRLLYCLQDPFAQLSRLQRI